MTNGIDVSVVRKIARLARIKIEPDEELEMVAKLNNIIDVISVLQEVNTDGVPETSSVITAGIEAREDVISDGNKQSEVLSNASQKGLDILFVVPKVVE